MLATDEQRKAFESLFRTDGTRLTYKKNEFVIRPGEMPRDVFFIESGLIKAYDITKYGEDNLLIIRRPGEIFPLIWALTGQEHHVIYETLSISVLWQLSRERLIEFIHQNPDAYVPLLDMVVEMYRAHSDRIFNLEYRSVRERLISFLVTMSHRFGRETSRGLLIDVPLRHQDIASSINTSRETTSREIAILERQGLIINQQANITLLNYDKLRSLL